MCHYSAFKYADAFVEIFDTTFDKAEGRVNIPLKPLISKKIGEVINHKAS
ncbi:hypothetical protein NUBL21976_37640 [Klebsiella pneumoniae]|nr:hypothetical protein NUBL21976_37640 [Klebsiella pneumoniae]